MWERRPAAVEAAIGQPWVRTLPWDSAHFGFKVGEIVSPALGEDELAAALSWAREARYRLVYWSTQPSRRLPVRFDDFGATPVNHRVQYSTDLSSDQTESNTFALDGGLRIVSCPSGPAGQTLEELAILAGAHSRFHVDPRIPVDRFESLYRIWVNRSTRRELADEVLVATPSGAMKEAIGFITVSRTSDCGQIGLVAVHPHHQGRGVGSLLMTKSHDWMRRHGVRTVSVVTQLENVPACRLYSRWNYTPAHAQAWFHFWLDSGECWLEPRLPGEQTGAV